MLLDNKHLKCSFNKGNMRCIRKSCRLAGSVDGLDVRA